MGVNECYTVWNVNGSVFGNCGYNSTAFHRCAPRYVLPPATIMRVSCVYTYLWCTYEVVTVWSYVIFCLPLLLLFFLLLPILFPFPFSSRHSLSFSSSLLLSSSLPSFLPSSFLSSQLPPVMYFVVSFTALLEHTGGRLLPISQFSLSVFLLQIVQFNVASEPRSS